MILKNYISVNRRAPLFTLAWQGGFLAVGIAMVLVINTFLNEDPDYACMGSVFALVATFISVIARGNMYGGTRLSLAVAMGQTRRSFLLCDSLVTLLTGALGMVTAWLAYQGESRLYALLYPGYINDLPLDGFYRLRYILPVLLGMTVLELVFSALILRYGGRAFRVVWLCLCFGCLLIPRMVEAHREGSASLFARMGGVVLSVVRAVPAGGWMALGCAAAAGAAIFAVGVLRRAEVKL